AAHFGWLKPDRPFSWLGSMVAVIIFSLLALAELIADKLPNTPNRTAAVGLSARILTGAFTGACLAVSGGNHLFFGALLGIAGAFAGTFVGFKARTGIVKALGAPVVVALAEDLIAIGGSLFV